MIKRKRHPAAAALLALFTGLLLLPPITAQAGPGSTEVLVDNDNNALTAPVREFGGATRYETSLAAAQRFVNTARSLGTPVTTALIASGESLVDAAAAAGLARAANAPVLLTRSDTLFAPAAHLIESEGISRVLVLGEVEAISEAVSAQVVAALAAVPGVTSVARIGGADRYVTAALIAQQMNSQADYCGTGQVSAILVRGEDGTFADITTAGPLSYAFGIPILLTTAEGLPVVTSEALTSLGVGHVVAIGAAATSGLASELANLGINSVTSLAGSDVSATSVDLLRALSACLGESFSDNTIALISATALPDGISAAPMLGQGLGTFGETTPVLLVETSSLPVAVRDFLASQCQPLELTAIGGEDAIAANVLSAAVAAANSARACDDDRDDTDDDRDGDNGDDRGDNRDRDAPTPNPLALVDAAGTALAIADQTLTLRNDGTDSASFNVGVIPGVAKPNAIVTATSSNSDVVAVSVTAERTGEATHRVILSKGPLPGSAIITISASSPGPYSDVRYQFSATNLVGLHFINEIGGSLVTPAQTLPAMGTGSQSKSITFGVSLPTSEPVSLTITNSNSAAVTTVLTEEVNGEATHRLTFNKNTEPGVATITIRAEANGYESATHTFLVTNAVALAIEDVDDVTLADGADPEVFTVMVTPEDAAGLDLQVTVSGTAGAVTASRVPVAGTAGSFEITLTKGDTPGTATVTLTATAPGYETGTVSFTVTNQIALSISGAIYRVLVPGDNGNQIRVTVMPTDVAGVSVSGEVTDRPDLLTVDPITPLGDSMYLVWFRREPTASVPGDSTVTLTATAPGYEDGIATFVVRSLVQLETTDIGPQTLDADTNSGTADVTITTPNLTGVMVTARISGGDREAVVVDETATDLGSNVFRISFRKGSIPGTARITVTAAVHFSLGYSSAMIHFEVTNEVNSE